MTLDQYLADATDAQKARFLVVHYNLKVANKMSQARLARSQHRYGAMNSCLISARVASTKARLALREARRLEAQP